MNRPRPIPLETVPLPMPTRSCETSFALYHPLEKSIWLLSAAGGLWRYRDETWTLISHEAELMPEGYSAVYSWGYYFFWDESRKAPVWFATGYGGTEHPVMGVWNGTRFEEATPKEGIKSSNRDTFVWDPERNVLVHFVSTRGEDPRYPAGTLHARELDKSGVWRDVGPAQKMTDTVDLMGGYDRNLHTAVCISADGIAYGWDGSTWTTIPVEVTYPWHPYATATAAKTGAMVFVYAPRETGKWPAHVLEQSGGKLRAKPISGLLASAGMVHHEANDRTYVFGPYFGGGTLQHTWATYDKGVFSPAGRVYAGQKPFLAPGHLFGDAGRPGLYWLSFPDGPEKPLAEVLPAAPDCIAHATTERGLYAIGGSGETSLHAYGSASFLEHAKAPEDFPVRNGTSVGADYRGDRVLLVSGTTPSYGPFPKDAWLLAANAWTKLALTGTAPALSEAALAFDATRKRWILAGGRDKGYKDGSKTFETDEVKWKAFPTSFIDTKGNSTGAIHVSSIAYDPVSGQTFCLAGHYGNTRAYGYEGEGVWRLLHEGPAEGAFDPTTRRLAWREGHPLLYVRTLDLGPALDTFAATCGSAPKAEPKGKTKVRVPAVASEVWLRYQDDSADKLWFARLHGTSFTVRWGKRGAALQEKTTAAKDEADASKKYAALVKAKLDKGYEHAAEGEAVAKLPGLRAFHITGKTRSEDVWGGVPQGLSEDDWPTCGECQKALVHVATFHAHPDRLPLTKHAAVMAFVCGEEMCEFWDPDSGANRVLLRTADELLAPSRKAPPKGTEKAKRQIFSYEEVFEVDLELEPNAPSIDTCDKVGGYPAWLQGDDRPACATCSAPMRFVAQLNERDLNFTGGGMSYIFLCDDEHEGKLLMQR